MTKTILKKCLKLILLEGILEIIYFPFWWYSKGLKNAFIKFWKSIVYRENQLALIIWTKSLFKPMYAQTDWQGKIISFFFRLLFLVIKTIKIILWIIFYFIRLVLWIILPPIVIYQIILNIKN